MHIEEEMAFWALVQLIKNYKMDKMFGGTLPLLSECISTFKDLLQKFLPKIYNHLVSTKILPLLFFSSYFPYKQKSFDISLDSFCSGWFCTLFSFKFPLEIVFRVWDIFLVERNFHIFFKLGLAIMKVNEANILSNKSFEECFLLLQKIENSLPEVNVLLAEAFKFKSVESMNVMGVYVSYNGDKNNKFENLKNSRLELLCSLGVVDPSGTGGDQGYGTEMIEDNGEGESNSNKNQQEDEKSSYKRVTKTLRKYFSQYKSIKSISITGKRLTSLPPEISVFTFMSVLNLTKNRLKDLPACFGNLQKIKKVNMSRNLLMHVPQVLFDLIGIQELILSFNKISHLQSYNGNHFTWKMLTKLKLDNNNLRTFPEEINVCFNLEVGFPATFLFLFIFSFKKRI